jgi:hypothetical protein
MVLIFFYKKGRFMLVSDRNTLVEDLSVKCNYAQWNDEKFYQSYIDFIDVLETLQVNLKYFHFEIDMISKQIYLVFEKNKTLGDYYFSMKMTFSSKNLFKTIRTNVLLISEYKKDASTETLDIEYNYYDFPIMMIKNIINNEFANSFTSLFNLCNENKQKEVV